jgi:hypothetical protein
MRVTVHPGNDKGALPGQGLVRLCLTYTAPTDVGANGLLHGASLEAASGTDASEPYLRRVTSMSGYNPNQGLQQDRRSASSVVAQEIGAA